MLQMDSMRGLFGYAAGESAAGGEIVECGEVTAEFLPDAIRMQKKRKFFDTEKTPMMKVGRDGNDGGMRFRRAANLGNRTRNANPAQSHRISCDLLWCNSVAPDGHSRHWDWV